MGEGAGWRIPPNPMPPDTAPEDVTWATPRRRSQPIKTFEQKIRIASREPPLPRAYIYAKRSGPATPSASSPTAPKARRAGSITRWMPATIRTSPARRT